MASLTGRPKLLFLCQTLPYPPDGGVWIRTYHILRLLARAFDITALCFERSSAPGSGATWSPAASRDALSRFAAVDVFPIPQRHSRIRYAWDHCRSLAFRRVYTTYLYDSRAFRRQLRRLMQSTDFDLVHVDSLDLADYLPACRDVPVVCVHHNVESALLERRAAIERNRWRSAYLRYQARLTEEVERHWCERVALNVAVSDQDRAALKQIAPASRVTVVPNGVDTREFHPDATAGTGIGFVGGATWFPNLDALDFFSQDILPHVRAASGDLPVRWIGSASPAQQQAYGEQCGIYLTGYVDDVRPLMRVAACHIVPLRAGGGTRLKILNSWAMGKPVVSTSIGCEGLAAVDGENILIRDNPKEFADAILAVLKDRDLGRRLGAGGRATVERHYSWDVIGTDLVDTYLRIGNADRQLQNAARRGGPACPPQGRHVGRPLQPGF